MLSPAALHVSLRSAGGAFTVTLRVLRLGPASGSLAMAYCCFDCCSDPARAGKFCVEFSLAVCLVKGTHDTFYTVLGLLACEVWFFDIGHFLALVRLGGFADVTPVLYATSALTNSVLTGGLQTSYTGFP